VKSAKFVMFSLLVIASMVLAACGPTPEPQVVEKVVTEVVEKQVIVTQVVEGQPVEVTKVVKEEVTKVVKEEVVVTATPEPTMAPPTGPVSGGTLRFGMTNDFSHFNPGYLGYEEFPVRAQLYDTLIRYDHAVQPQPRLAEAWEMSDDGLTLTIHLRQGAKFHNGREMVADDIVKNLAFAQNTDTCYHMCQVSAKIESAEVLDDYTVVFHYSQFDAGWQDFIADWYIIAPEAFDSLQTAPMGTGPFVFQEYVPDDHTIFVKNEDYWGTEGPYVDEVYIRSFGTDQDAMVAALESGEIDLTHQSPVKDQARLIREGFNVFDGQPGAFVDVIYASSLGIPETKVRQAIMYSIDWNALWQGVYFGTGQLGARMSYPDTSWAFFPEFESDYAYDPEKAKALLTEAGYPDGIDIEYNAASLDYIQGGLIIRDSMKASGINLNVVPLESTQWNTKYYGGVYGVAMSYIANSNLDPSRLFVNSQYRCENTPSKTDEWPVHPETGESYCALLREASATPDIEKRKELYYKIEQIMDYEAWAIGYRLHPIGFAAAPYVQGFDWRVDNGILLENVWLTPH
jgi:peptide/nickel transport system substrate-binding protein